MVGAVIGRDSVVLGLVGGRKDEVIGMAVLLEHAPSVLGPLVHQDAP